jgi:hypothetical protein
VPDQENASKKLDVLPGILGPFDYSSEDFADLSEDAKKALKTIVDRCAKQDMAARRFEVEQTWEGRLFYRGYQHLLRRSGGGWILPQEQWRREPGKLSSIFDTNIYTPYADIIIAALTRETPPVRFEPQDPQSDPDITTAEAADKYKTVFAQDNDLYALHTDLARYLWTDGRSHVYTRHVLDAQRFGMEDAEDENPVEPETEVPGGQAQPGETGGPSGGSPDASASPSGDDSGAQSGTEQDTEGVQPQPESGGPRGQEVSDCYGKLEVKVCPINSRTQHQYTALGFSMEYDTAYVKGMFPWIADKIKPSSGVGELELDRIARINVAIALSASYVTGDAMVRDCTVGSWWLRPCAFLDGLDDEEIQQELLDTFPDGCKVVYAGQEYAYSRNETMDDHWSTVLARPSDGQNGAGLGTWLLPIQKRVNNWVDLLNDYFVKCVPMKHMDSQVFNIEALKKLGNVPGLVNPFQRVPGVPAAELVFIEPTPTHQPSFPDTIWKFINELPQFMCGALPSLFGGDASTDTVGGIAMQRDQALGRLGITWHAIQSGAAVYNRQAVMCAAKCRKPGDSIRRSIGNDALTIEVADLKGNIQCYPESDSNFPESPIQKEARWQQLLDSAAKNPVAAKLLTSGHNLKIAKDNCGFEDADLPETDSDDKQLAEIDLLIKAAPIPNPQIVQAQQQLMQMMSKAKMVPPEEQQQFAQSVQQATQAIQQLQQTMPLISSVEVDDKTDNHAVEAATCLRWINSPAGRKMRNGLPEEKAGFMNVRVHFLQHSALAAQQQAQQMVKPPAEQINFKDLDTPEEKNQMLKQASIQGNSKATAPQAPGQAAPTIQ